MFVRGITIHPDFDIPVYYICVPYNSFLSFDTFMINNNLDSVAREVVCRLREQGYVAYYAGGYVRDRLLGINHKQADIDIATNARPETIASLFHKVVGVGEHFGVMLVIEQGVTFEVATFRSDVGIADGRHPERVVYSTAEQDARRRDFTINGLFYDPVEDKVLDYVGGRRDLQEGIIRSIGDAEQRFREDYLRLLRAVRFSARFSFSIEPYTWKSIVHHAPAIIKVSQERIFQELTKMLTGPNPRLAMQLLYDCGLMAHVLPEVNTLAGVEQPPEFHPEGDVLEHTLLALEKLHSEPSTVTAWSTLLHDIGKPSTKTVEDRIRFNNHHHVGAQMARRVLRRLRAPRRLIEEVSDCIDNHMNWMNVTRMRLSTLKKFLARPTIEDELELHRVDCLSSHGDLQNYYFIKEKQKEFAEESLRPQPLLGGKDLIELGFTPGPRFGEILDAVYEQQLEEHITTKEQAIDWVKSECKV